MVIKGDLIPSARAVTLFAGLGELPLMEILVAIRAAGVDRFELALTVTAVTIEPLMLPLEGEAADPMIEGLN